MNPLLWPRAAASTGGAGRPQPDVATLDSHSSGTDTLSSHSCGTDTLSSHSSGTDTLTAHTTG